MEKVKKQNVIVRLSYLHDFIKVLQRENTFKHVILSLAMANSANNIDANDKASENSNISTFCQDANICDDSNEIVMLLIGCRSFSPTSIFIYRSNSIL